MEAYNNCICKYREATGVLCLHIGILYLHNQGSQSRLPRPCSIFKYDVCICKSNYENKDNLKNPEEKNPESRREFLVLVDCTYIFKTTCPSHVQYILNALCGNSHATLQSKENVEVWLAGQGHCSSLDNAKPKHCTYL